MFSKLYLIVIFFLMFSCFDLEAQNSDLELGKRFLKLGNTYRQMQNYESALKYLNDGYKISRRYRDSYWEAVANEYFGYYFSDLGDSTTAKVYFRKAHTLYKKSVKQAEGSPQAISELLNNYDMLYGKQLSEVSAKDDIKKKLDAKDTEIAQLKKENTELKEAIEDLRIELGLLSKKEQENKIISEQAMTEVLKQDTVLAKNIYNFLSEKYSNPNSVGIGVKGPSDDITKKLGEYDKIISMQVEKMMKDSLERERLMALSQVPKELNYKLDKMSDDIKNIISILNEMNNNLPGDNPMITPVPLTPINILADKSETGIIENKVENIEDNINKVDTAVNDMSENTALKNNEQYQSMLNQIKASMSLLTQNMSDIKRELQRLKAPAGTKPSSDLFATKEDDKSDIEEFIESTSKKPKQGQIIIKTDEGDELVSTPEICYSFNKLINEIGYGESLTPKPKTFVGKNIKITAQELAGQMYSLTYTKNNDEYKLYLTPDGSAELFINDVTVETYDSEEPRETERVQEYLNTFIDASKSKDDFNKFKEKNTN